MNLVFLGMPGSGKGTQGQRYAREHGWHHYSSGDVYRDLVKRKSPKALEAERIVSGGGFFTDELAIDLLVEGLEGKGKCVIDGTPRTIGQARAMDKRGIEISYAIHFSLPDEVAIERMKARRTCLDCHAIYGIVPAPETCCRNHQNADRKTPCKTSPTDYSSIAIKHFHLSDIILHKENSGSSTQTKRPKKFIKTYAKS